MQENGKTPSDFFILKRKIAEDNEFNRIIERSGKGDFQILQSEENLIMVEINQNSKEGPSRCWAIYFYLPQTKEIYMISYGTSNLNDLEQKKNFYPNALRMLYLDIKEGS
ncbi:MAG: hypothetical protein L0207_03650 [Chlamydiae bacterium]|nr:hypothetical protein [Chlamydiota bacterium]